MVALTNPTSTRTYFRPVPPTLTIPQQPKTRITKDGYNSATTSSFLLPLIKTRDALLSNYRTLGIGKGEPSQSKQ